MNFIKNILGNLKLQTSKNNKMSNEPKPAELVDEIFANFDFPKDIHSANRLVVGSFFKQVAPFTLWKPANLVIKPELEIIAKNTSHFVILKCWYLFLAMQHGRIASNMLMDEMWALIDALDEDASNEDNLKSHVKVFMQGIDDAIEHFENTPDSKRSIKTSNGENIELPWEYFLAIRTLIKSVDSPYFEKKGSDFNGDEYTLMECFANARFIGQAYFEKLKNSYTTFDPQTLTTWQWKSEPGLYEQHLMRRYASQYFDADKRNISVVDVYEARVKDSNELSSYYSQAMRLKKEILDDDAPNNYMDFIMLKREEIDELIDKVIRLGVGANGLDVMLDNLRKSLIDIWKYIYTEQNNSKGLELLEKAEIFNQSNSIKFRPNFINAIGHESLPAEDVVSAFLSLSFDELKKVVKYMESDEENRTPLLHLRSGSLDYVKSRINDFHNFNEVREKLAIVGVAI